MADRQKPVANRAVSDRYSKYVHALHRANVSQVKPVVNTMPPATLPQISGGASQLKRKQQEIERQTMIARDNRILVEKMERIRQQKKGPYAEQPYIKPSLNRESRARQLAKIDKENQALYERIQARKPILSTQEWKRHHIQNELRLKTISKFDYQPRLTDSDLTAVDDRTGNPIVRGDTRRLMNSPGRSTSPGMYRNATGGYQQGPQQQQQQQLAQNTCVFSERGVRVGGIYSTLSVYERLKPFRLDFVARDDGGRSTLVPVSLPFRDLKRVFADRPDILAPENTELLVKCVLPALWWHEQKAKFVLQLALDRIAVPSGNGVSNGNLQLEGVPATNVRPRCLDESSTSSGSKQDSKTPEEGKTAQPDDCLYEFSVRCSGLVNSPLTGECNPVVFVWKRTAKVEEEANSTNTNGGTESVSQADEKFVYVDRTECCLQSPEAAFQKVVGIPLNDDDFRTTLRKETARKSNVISTYRFDVCEMVNGQAQEVLGAADVSPSDLAGLVLNHFSPGSVPASEVLTLKLKPSPPGDGSESHGSDEANAGTVMISFSPPRSTSSETANPEQYSASESSEKNANVLAPESQVAQFSLKLENITVPNQKSPADDYDDDFEASTDLESKSSQISSIKIKVKSTNKVWGETETAELQKSKDIGFKTPLSIDLGAIEGGSISVEVLATNLVSPIGFATLVSSSLKDVTAGSPLTTEALDADGKFMGRVIISRV